jgi:hypothetical protein
VFFPESPVGLCGDEQRLVVTALKAKGKWMSSLVE